MSKNFSRGYGPQEYFLRKAVPGNYDIKVSLYSPPTVVVEHNGGVNALVKIYTNFGRLDEKEYNVTVSLNKHKELVSVANIVNKNIV